tara:strand:+ start:61 stop:357 length:297 start_codon:yes stop_codon:yes gene_type:complete
MTINDLDKMIDQFALRLAAGEVMESPEDLQFYANYSKSIETVLRGIQIVDEAKAKYAKEHQGGHLDNMTKRIYGIRQWGTLTEQEAINVLLDIRRRFE